MGKALRRKLRAQPTAAEIRFWRLIFSLRTGGWHFRKQVQVGAYYVDFACLHAGVVVEIDGDTHGIERVQRNDETRDRYLRERGFVVLRFTDEDVLNHPDGVYEVLVAALERRPGNRRGSPPPQPSPQGGGCWAGEIDQIAILTEGTGGEPG